MNDLAIQVRHISKSYRLGEYDFIKDLSGSIVHALRREEKPLRQVTNKPDEFSTSDRHIWALKDISFDIPFGEKIGIIGPNGSGKTTLLKILSRITKPTRGFADIYGKLGALLEVGTGFHPDLTGKENIYLNASILGLNKQEIDRRYDQIVDFSELEEFIDTPVKHYSSGMYMRLAFAVSSHIEPDILLLDEVLSVGDASFQKKCFDQIDRVSKKGRTVVLVSHDLPAIVTFCDRCLLLEKGRLIADGFPSEVAEIYIRKMLPFSEAEELDLSSRSGNQKAQFQSLKISAINEDGKISDTIKVGYDLKIELKLAAIQKIIESNVALIVFDLNNYRIIDVNTAIKGKFVTLEAGQTASIEFLIKNVLLKPGTYRLGLWCGRKNVEIIDSLPNARSINIHFNPQKVQHHQIFPGLYQCEFDVLRIEI